jgi:hypothetical protein
MESHRLYQGTVLLNFNPARHTYEVGDEIVPGVTSITGVLAKNLVGWAAREVADAVGQEWQSGRGYNETEISAILEKAKGAPNRKKDTAADIGHIVHAAAENFIKGDEKAELADPQAKAGFESFLKWYEENVDYALTSEGVVYSKEHKYAGTYDLSYVDKKGRRVLADIKTSSGLWPEMWLQVAGYEIALREEGIKPFDVHVLINCKKTGELEVQESTDFEENAPVFLACLAIHNRLKEMKK